MHRKYQRRTGPAPHSLRNSHREKEREKDLPLRYSANVHVPLILSASSVTPFFASNDSRSLTAKEQKTHDAVYTYYYYPQHTENAKDEKACNGPQRRFVCCPATISRVNRNCSSPHREMINEVCLVSTLTHFAIFLFHIKKKYYFFLFIFFHSTLNPRRRAPWFARGVGGHHCARERQSG